ncbi:MAG: crossover junction endodeoxyribonuclease RuvC [Negativicutes bacterium]|jgi:crossover junction endodeoxyribonuclease RuvC
MRALGIDPGTAICGYGLVESIGSKLVPVHCGAVLTASATEMPLRLLKIFDELNKIIGDCRPDVVAIEQLFFNKNVKTALSVGQARGVIMLVAAKNNLPILEYTPLQVKQAVVGYGKADKQQVAYMVMRLLGIKEQPKPDDVTDALAIAVCAIHSSANSLSWR